MTEQHSKRRRRLIGMGFVTAFVLSTATIIYTGLNVRAPGSHRSESATAEAPANVTQPLEIEREEGDDVVQESPER